MLLAANLTQKARHTKSDRSGKQGAEEQRRADGSPAEYAPTHTHTYEGTHDKLVKSPESSLSRSRYREKEDRELVGEQSRGDKTARKETTREADD